MITQSQILSGNVFKVLNSNHDYILKIREYAEHGITYEMLDYSSLMEITKLYLAYIGDESIDIEISKSLAIKILHTNDYINMSKIVGDLEYERDEIICRLIDKYKDNISENIDDEIERLKDIITNEEILELSSVNATRYL